MPVLNFKRSALVFVVATAIAVVTGVTARLDPGLIDGAPQWFAAAATSALVVWATTPWWRRIDEAAREAHKSAFFWGGAFGMGLALFLGALEIGVDQARGGPIPEWFLGAVFVVILQTLGYGLFWVVWWLRRSGWGPWK